MNQDPTSRMLTGYDQDRGQGTPEALAAQLNSTINTIKRLMAVRITNEDDLQASRQTIEDSIWQNLLANMHGAEPGAAPSRHLLIEQLNHAVQESVMHMFTLVDGLEAQGARLDIAITPVVDGVPRDANYLIAHPMATKPNRLEEAANATAQALFVLTGRPDLPYGTSIHQETGEHVTYLVEGLQAERVRPNLITGVHFIGQASGLPVLNINFVHPDLDYYAGLSGNAPSPNVPLDWIGSVQLHRSQLSELGNAQ